MKRFNDLAFVIGYAMYEPDATLASITEAVIEHLKKENIWPEEKDDAGTPS